MNKQLQALEKATLWKERRTSDGNYIERLDKNGNVYERVYSPIPKQTTIKKPTQARPQPPKVKPPSKTRYTPTPEQEYIRQQGDLALEKQLQNQKYWFNLFNQNAKEAQQSNQKYGRELQDSINNTNLRMQEKRTWGDVEEAKITSGSNQNIAKTQAESAGNVANINAKSAETVAGINAESAFKVTELETKSKNYGYDKQYEWTKYQADRDAEARNRQTDANYFVEREKNANQKEKNKQDFYLNAGLGILDSMNKQRASSSQAAAQIYSSFLSSNPYNFKYWN